MAKAKPKRKKRPGPGRPPKAKADRHSVFVGLRVTPAEAAELNREARESGKTRSEIILGAWRERRAKR